MALNSVKLIISITLCSYLKIYVNCNGCESKMFRHKDGLIKLKTYSTWEHCTLSIKPNLDPNVFVHLHFTKFKLNGVMPGCFNSDSVEINIGCGVKQKISTFCTDSFMPHDIYSRDGCIDIKVTLTSDISTYRYFEAEYRSVSYFNGHFKGCKNDYDWKYLPSSGIFASPHWPRSYEANSGHTFLSPVSCKWMVNIKHGKSIQLNFMDFQLSKKSNLDCDYIHDQVTLLGWSKSMDLSSRISSSKYCSSETNGLTRNIDIRKIIISFATYSRTLEDDRGFLIGYVVYDKKTEIESKQLKKSSSGGIIAVIVIIMLLAVAIFCGGYYRRRRRRRRRRQQEHTVMLPIRNNTHDTPINEASAIYEAIPVYHDAPPAYNEVINEDSDLPSYNEVIAS